MAAVLEAVGPKPKRLLQSALPTTIFLACVGEARKSDAQVSLFGFVGAVGVDRWHRPRSADIEGLPETVFAFGVVPLPATASVPWWPAVPVGDDGGGESPTVVLPQAWQEIDLPDSYICAALAQVAIARGEEWQYDDESGALLVGGRVMIGTRGNPFRFAGAEQAGTWVAISSGRFASDLAYLDALSESSRAVFKEARMKKGLARVAPLIENAAKMADAAKQRAIAAEAQFYKSKWDW